MAGAASGVAAHLPVGPPVDARPARRPEAVRLEGRFGLVEKLLPHHAAALWQAVRDHDHIWTYMSSYGPFDDGASFHIGSWAALCSTIRFPMRWWIPAVRRSELQP
jgi:hypothetical protein